MLRAVWSSGLQPVLGHAGHDVQPQGVVLTHVGLGLVGEQCRGLDVLHGQGAERLAEVGRTEDGLDGVAGLESAEQGDVGAGVGGEGLRQSHLSAAVGQLLEDGGPEPLLVADGAVLHDGGVETVVEPAHAAGIEADAGQLLRVVVVADGLLGDAELRRLLGLAADDDGLRRGVVVGCGVVGGLAGGVGSGLVVGQPGAELRGVDVVQLAEGVEQGGAVVCRLLLTVGVAQGVGADDTQRVAVVADEAEQRVGL